MPITKVDQMNQAPSQCVCCGGNPYKDGKAQEAFDLDTDINWGDHGFICIECANVMADLLGRVDKETHDAVNKELQRSEKENARLLRINSKRNRELKTVRDASKIVNV